MSALDDLEATVGLREQAAAAYHKRQIGEIDYLIGVAQQVTRQILGDYEIEACCDDNGLLEVNTRDRHIDFLADGLKFRVKVTVVDMNTEKASNNLIPGIHEEERHTLSIFLPKTGSRYTIRNLADLGEVLSRIA